PQPRTCHAFEQRLVPPLFQARIDVHDIPALANVSPLAPAQQQPIQDPAQGFVDKPQKQAHDRNEGKHDGSHLGGFFARGPDDPLDFVVRVAQVADAAPAGFAEPRNERGHDDAADEYADPRHGGLVVEHRRRDDAGNDDEHRETQLEAVYGAANGFYAGVRHIRASDLAAIAACFAAAMMAGAVGIEPTTFGFGDRRSAN